jgi:hypothetical protein
MTARCFYNGLTPLAPELHPLNGAAVTTNLFDLLEQPH